PTMVVVDVLEVVVCDVVVVGRIVSVVVVGTVVVVVVQPAITVWLHPAIGSQVSVVQGFPSLQLTVRHVVSHGWQGAFDAPLSQVSGNSFTPLPHTGHGTRHIGGVFAAVQTGSKCTSVGSSGGENAPLTGKGWPSGSVTEFRLFGSTPVVWIAAPASSTSDFRAVRRVVACGCPPVLRIPVAPTWMVQAFTCAIAGVPLVELPTAC